MTDQRLPGILNLELTNACNLACVFCDHCDLARRMRIRSMEPEFLNRLLLDLPADPFEELGLVGLGEPLLDQWLPQHLETVARHRRRFQRITLNTNMLAVTPELADRICSSVITHMTISLNACDRATYARLMGLDAFDRALEGIRLFMATRSRLGSGPQIAIQLLDSDLNDQARLKTLLGPVILSQAGLFTRRIYNKPALAENRPPLRLSENNEIRHPCWSLYSRAYVDVEGRLYPCTIGNDCFRETSALCLGDLHQNGLAALFNGPRMASARKRAEQGLPAFKECEQCNVWSLLPNHFEWNRDACRWMKKTGERLRLRQMDWLAEA